RQPGGPVLARAAGFLKRLCFFGLGRGWESDWRKEVLAAQPEPASLSAGRSWHFVTILPIEARAALHYRPHSVRWYAEVNNRRQEQWRQRTCLQRPSFPVPSSPILTTTGRNVPVIQEHGRFVP